MECQCLFSGKIKKIKMSSPDFFQYLFALKLTWPQLGVLC